MRTTDRRSPHALQEYIYFVRCATPPSASNIHFEKLILNDSAISIKGGLPKKAAKN